MYGPLVAAAAILLGIAGIVLYLSDVSLSRAERAARSFDRTYVRNRAARHRRQAGKAPARGGPPPSDPDPGPALRHAAMP